jgi:hypothetical protein
MKSARAGLKTMAVLLYGMTQGRQPTKHDKTNRRTRPPQEQKNRIMTLTGVIMTG